MESVMHLSKKSEVLKCQQCPKTFNHKNSLIYHLRSHTGERPYKCDSCGKRFFATSALKVHKRLHSGAWPYPCDLCGKRFRQWGDLKYHKISIHSGEKSYQCEFCGKDFARKYSLTVHRRIHTGERDYKCEFCSKCFRAASYLQNHRRIHTGEKRHKCPTCGKAFRVLSDMKRHMASHNRDAKNRNGSMTATITVQTVAVSCENGAGSSASKLLPVISSSTSSHSKIVQVSDNTLVQHQQNIPIITSISTNSNALPSLDDHTSSSNFKIKSAEELSLSGPVSNQSVQSQMIASEGTLLPATAYNVTLTDGSSVYSASDIIATTMGTRGIFDWGRNMNGERNASSKTSEVLKCQQCPKTFNHKNSLIYHLRSHTGERPYKCDSCGKRFFATSALKVHKRLHSGARPYPCELCGKRFRQWGDLKYHKISIHSGEKSYQCEICGKDFARKYSLTVHRRIHTGERDYKCEFCSKCFRAASYLQNHRRIHTGEKPHKCPTCGKAFRVLSDMKRHMASHNRDAKNRNGSITATITVQTVAVSCENGAGSSDSKLLPVISSSTSSHSKIVQVSDNTLVQHQQNIPIITSISTNSNALPSLDDHTSSSNFKIKSAEELSLSGPVSNQSVQSQMIASEGTLLPATAYKVTLTDGSSVYSASDIIATTMVSEGMTIYQDTGQNLEVLAEQVTQTNTVVLVPLTHAFIQDW